MFPTIFTLAGGLLAGTAHAASEPQSGHQAWLGDRYLGAVLPPAPGVHTSPVQHFGPTALTVSWEYGAPGTAPQGPHIATPGGQLLDAWLPARKELVIVTTEALAQGSSVLPAYLDRRETDGWNVVLATEADWDTGDGDRPARIRRWLAERYAADPGAFLLLIGDPRQEGDLPMRETHPLLYFMQRYFGGVDPLMDPVPTDFYYAELTGDWDADGDGLYGEWPVGDEAGMDAVPELYVGRLPVYGGDSAALDAMLDRVLRREEYWDKSHRRTALLAAALRAIEGGPTGGGGDSLYSATVDNAVVLDRVHRDLPADLQAAAIRQYEDEGEVISAFAHEEGLSATSFFSAWEQREPGLVVWLAHGLSWGSFRYYWEDSDGDGEISNREVQTPSFIEAHDVVHLPEAATAFVLMGSCENGYPEDPANLAASVLTGGSTAAVAATRVSLTELVGDSDTWEPAPEVAWEATVLYYAFQALAEGHTVGEALAWTKYALDGTAYVDMGDGLEVCADYFAWFNRMEFNLYGDPTQSLERCERDDDCDDRGPRKASRVCSAGFCQIHDPEPIEEKPGGCGCAGTGSRPGPLAALISFGLGLLVWRRRGVVPGQ
ncbi:MAG: C25 family cysteine peptidase [Pseudomonadota bacterium]